MLIYRVNQAFNYIERVVKSDFFSEMNYFTSYVHNIFCTTMSYISTIQYSNILFNEKKVEYYGAPLLLFINV